MCSAFTMIELVFVIVVVGILAGIAIPKFAATRDDAIITKARATVGAVRSALATEKQKRILRGKFDMTVASVPELKTFTIKYNDNNTSKLLEYGIKVCSGSSRNCWTTGSTTGEFIFRGPGSDDCTFKIENGKFDCKKSECSVTGLKDMCGN